MVGPPFDCLANPPGGVGLTCNRGLSSALIPSTSDGKDLGARRLFRHTLFNNPGPDKKLLNAGVHIPPDLGANCLPTRVSSSGESVVSGLPWSPLIEKSRSVMGKSLKFSRQTSKKEEEQDEGIRIGHLHRLNQKNICPSNMNRLMNIVRREVLSTLDDNLDRGIVDESWLLIHNDKEDEQEEGIRIDPLHRLIQKNISSWKMKRLMKIVRREVLSTLDEDLDTGIEDESSLQIAKAGATTSFHDVAKPGSKKGRRDLFPIGGFGQIREIFSRPKIGIWRNFFPRDWSIITREVPHLLPPVSTPCIFTFSQSSPGYSLCFPYFGLLCVVPLDIRRFKLVSGDSHSGLVILLERCPDGRNFLRWFDCVGEQFLPQFFEFPFEVLESTNVTGAFVSSTKFSLVVATPEETFIFKVLSGRGLSIPVVEGHHPAVSPLLVGNNVYWLDLIDNYIRFGTNVTTEETTESRWYRMEEFLEDMIFVSCFLNVDLTPCLAIAREGEGLKLYSVELIEDIEEDRALQIREGNFNNLAITCLSDHGVGFCRHLSCNLDGVVLLACHDTSHCYVVEESENMQTWHNLLDCPHRRNVGEVCTCDNFCFSYDITRHDINL